MDDRYDPVTAEVVDLLGQIMLRFRHDHERAAGPLGLTYVQVKTLINGLEPITMSELSARLGAEPPNMTNIVDRLVSRGLVERRVDPVDRRVRRITTTAAGRAAVEQIRAGLGFAAQPLANLDDGGRAQLRDLLRRVVDPGRSGSPDDPTRRQGRGRA